MGVGAAIVGGAVVGAAGSYMAADKQADAVKASGDLQAQMYYQNREDMMPFMDAGKRALGQYENRLSSMPERPTLNRFRFDPSQIEENPAYQFRMEQGLEALERRLAGNRMLNSGNRLSAITDYAQGLASTEYGNEFNRQFSADQDERSRRLTDYGLRLDETNTINNRLAALLGVGQQSTGTVGQYGQQYSSNAGNALLAGGNAQAAGYMGMANSANNALNQYMYAKGNGMIGGGNFASNYLNNPWANSSIGGPRKF